MTSDIPTPVITGLGLISPIGFGVDAASERYLHHPEEIRTIEQWRPEVFGDTIVYKIRDFDELTWISEFDVPLVLNDIGLRKIHRRNSSDAFLSLCAAVEAVYDSQLKLDDEERKNVDVIVGCGQGSLESLIAVIVGFNEEGVRGVDRFATNKSMANSLANIVSQAFGYEGASYAVVQACSSSAAAMNVAYDKIMRGKDVVLVGGVEVPIQEQTIATFTRVGAVAPAKVWKNNPWEASRPYDANRNGFVPSTGAGFIVMESLKHAITRKAPKVYCEFLGYGETNDANADNFAESIPLIQGRAISNAVDMSGLSFDIFKYFKGHGTSTLRGDESETQATKSALKEHARNVLVSSIKSAIGHTLGASAVMEFVLATKALSLGFVPPTLNYTTPDPACDLNYVVNAPSKQIIEYWLATSFGFGGNNVAHAFRQLLHP